MNTHFPTPLEANEAHFWASCRARAMTLQRCNSCSAFRYPPRSVCPHCGGDAATWVAVRGSGTIYVALVVHPRGPAKSSEPQSIVLVDLAEGIRIWSTVVDCHPAAVRIGDRVRLAYRPVTGGVLPVFVKDSQP